MTDISKCPGEHEGKVCSKREECWRYLAPCGYRQSFFIPPEMGENCEYFFPKVTENTNRKKKIKNDN